MLRVITHNDTHTLGGTPWTSDRLIAEGPTYTINTREKHPCRGEIRTRDPSKRAATVLHFRPRGSWDWLSATRRASLNAQYIDAIEWHWKKCLRQLQAFGCVVIGPPDISRALCCNLIQLTLSAKVYSTSCGKIMCSEHTRTLCCGHTDPVLRHKRCLWLRLRSSRTVNPLVWQESCNCNRCIRCVPGSKHANHARVYIRAVRV